MKENTNHPNIELSNINQEIKEFGFIKSEVNFTRLPFFALSRGGLKKRGEIEYRDSVERDGEKLDILWRVTANTRYGYPGPFDKKVHKALEFLISQKGFPVENPITFSFYELCKLMNIEISGKTKRMIREALIRTKLAGIESRGSFYYKGEKRWIDDIFNLYDRVVFFGETLPSGETADRNYVFLSDWYLKSLNSFYVKPLDFSYYCSLQSTLSGRLYEFLSIQFYGLQGKPYSIEYHKLCQLLPIVEQKYVSNAKENLNSAHQELKETRFLTQVRWREIEKSRFITYYPGDRVRTESSKFKSKEQLELRLSISNELSTTNEEHPQSVIDSDMVERLVQRGITKLTAQRLINDYSTDQIQKQIEIFDYLVKIKSQLVAKNPAGFLRESIEENYQPPSEYNRKQEKEITEQKRSQERVEKEAEQARLDEIQHQVDEYRNNLTDEERQLLRQEAVGLIESDKAIRKEFVTEHLIRAKEAEIIRERLSLE
jgi:hypothetical protein